MYNTLLGFYPIVFFLTEILYHQFVNCELYINIDSSQNNISMATENHRVLSCLTMLKHLENNSLQIKQTDRQASWSCYHFSRPAQAGPGCLGQ